MKFLFSIWHTTYVINILSLPAYLKIMKILPCFRQSVQAISHVQLFVIPWTPERLSSMSIINSQSLLKLMFIELVMLSNHLILCRPLPLPLSIFPSIRVFSNESVLCIRWPNYQSCSFNISPSNEYSGLTSFRMDWLDLLAVQETLKSLLQHYSSRALILRCIQLVQFSRSVVSDSLRPHESQHARLPCPSSTPGVHSDSRPSSP